jgi:hypothetical protein
MKVNNRHGFDEARFQLNSVVVFSGIISHWWFSKTICTHDTPSDHLRTYIIRVKNREGFSKPRIQFNAVIVFSGIISCW